MDKLTTVQEQVFNFIREQLAAGTAPTVREIAGHFGWNSKRAAEKHVNALATKGWLLVEAGKARSLRLAEGVRPGREGVFELPVFGNIPAGFGDPREQEAEEFVPVTVESIGFKPGRSTFALRVNGDSMIGAHICHGDIVVLEHGKEPRSGEIVAALIDGKNTLKRYVVKGRKQYLKAENPAYPDLIPSEELVIQGVFMALIRKAAG